MYQPFAVGALVLFTAATSAQVPQLPGPQLIGVTRDTPLLRVQDPGTCETAIRCSVPLAPADQRWAGGTAFDSSTGGVWASTGRQLVLLDPETCEARCGPFPMLDAANQPSDALVTGLAMSESTGELMVIDSAGILTRLRRTNLNACQPVAVARCDTGLGGTATASTTGLAVDEWSRVLFLSYADFDTGASRIAVTPMESPCSVFQTLELSSCGAHPLGPVTGLAVDWCRRILWATDGYHTLVLRYEVSLTTAVPWVEFEQIGCCVAAVQTLADPFIGLALTPAATRPFGEPCANGACEPCGAMRHGILTGPTVGNPNLVFAADNVKANQPVWLVIGAGPCAVGPQPFPLCGPILVGLSDVRPLVAGPFWPVSPDPGGCNGRVRVPVKVPFIPLCGTEWSSQFIQLCFEPFAYGTAMSNCVSFVVGS